MGRTHDAIRIAAAIRQQLHRQAVKADIVADLLERASVAEWRDRVGPGLQSLVAESGCDGDHVLFGDPAIDEARSHRVPQRLQGHEPEIARQKDHPLIARAADKLATQFISHRSVSDLAIAPAYSSVVKGGERLSISNCAIAPAYCSAVKGR